MKIRLKSGKLWFHVKHFRQLRRFANYVRQKANAGEHSLKISKMEVTLKGKWGFMFKFRSKRLKFALKGNMFHVKHR